jgi:hypothetical protein
MARFSRKGFTQRREAAKSQKRERKRVEHDRASEIAKIVVDAATNRPKNNFNIWL